MPTDRDISSYGFSRRKALASGTGALVAGLSGCLGGDDGDGGDGGTTTGEDGEEYADTLNILMWPYYQMDEIDEPFREEYGISLNVATFDDNAEAYNQLRTGGAEEFDIVMADSYWPRLYDDNDLIQPLDTERLSNLDNIVDDFHPDNLDLHLNDDGEYLGTPNAWGGYGITYNPEEVPESDVESYMTSMYNEEYSGHISVTERPQMNVASAGVALGYDDPRGNVWTLCNDENQSELEEIRDLLIEQKQHLLMRYSDTRDLDRNYNRGDLWLFTEYSDTYRRLALEGEMPIEHKLVMDEGGFGWLEAWMMTSGVESTAKENAVYAFLDWRLEKQWMKVLAEGVGAAPTVDLTDEFDEEEQRIYFLDRTEQLAELTQFDVPDCPEEWEEYWTEVEAA